MTTATRTADNPQVATLRAAAAALCQSGHGSAILRGAVASRVWAPALIDRISTEVLGRRDLWSQAGVDGNAVLAAAGTKPPAVHPGDPAGGRTAPPGWPAALTTPAPPIDRGLAFPDHLFGSTPPNPQSRRRQNSPASPPVDADRATASSPATKAAPTANPSVTAPLRVQTLTAAAVLAQPGGDPLTFDNTLDGLRGVPITDLTTCQGAPGERMLAAGINTVYDVVTRVPLRYIDRTQLYTVDQLRPGMGQIAVVSKVVATKRFIGSGPGGGKGRARGMAHIVIGHTTRKITCTLFNQGWQANRFKAGDPVLVVGEVTVYTPKNGGRSQLQMTSPSIEPYDPAATAPLVPMYPQAERHQVTTWQIGRAAVEACRRINTLDDPVPAPLLEELMMPTRIDALRAVHVPESAAAAKVGRDRLAFDELLRLQLALGVRRAGQRELPAVTHQPTGELTGAYLRGLPWPLTNAQTKATAEIRADLVAKEPMNRILQGDVGSGKALTLDSLVLTPEGFRTMGEMTIGQRVINPTGEVTSVIGVFPQGARDVYRVNFSDGTSVMCDDEHLWAVQTSTGRSKGYSQKVKTLHEIRGDLYEKNGASKWHVDLPCAAELDDHGSRPVDPYLLGLLLGDGGISRPHDIRFTTADDELIAAFQQALPNDCELIPHQRYDWRVRGIYPDLSDVAAVDPASVCAAYNGGSTLTRLQPHLQMGPRGIRRFLTQHGTTLRSVMGRPPYSLLSGLRFLGLQGTTSHTKFVPKAYLNSSIGARHALLQGLMDTDGTVDRHGANLSYTSASRQLAADVAWLVRSLGGRARCREITKVGREYWHVSFSLPNQYPPFRLIRKAALFKPRTKYATPAKAIISVYYVGKELVQCIAVAHPNHLYITDHFTVTHNTSVLAAAALTAIEGGHQAALMAPTEILAVQHYQEMVQHLTGIGVVVGLLAARQGAKARRETLTALADGTIQLVVGTHSLLVDEVKFASLGLVLVDEQHRFGVEQRAKMMGKGPNGATPDLLVATATPIPRTAALSAFGDLDMSVLDEMPPGRTPIQTWHHQDLNLRDPADRAWALVREQVAQGRQAYVVCPMVAESEKAQAAAAEETLEALQAGALHGLRLGLATGKQPSAERSAVMGEFTAGNLDILVATTVIEVGVNVPNSTVIVILDSARFGLAQLHQLRGRVGRGSQPGHCVLAGDTLTEVGEARIMAMCNTTDGFVLSEIDMQLRGPGALAGVAQAGKNIGMAVADLLKDTDLMLSARDVARTILVSDPKLGRRPTLRHEVEAALGEDSKWLLHS